MVGSSRDKSNGEGWTGTVSEQKERLRRERLGAEEHVLREAAKGGGGKAAQRLSLLAPYKKARRVLVSLDPFLRQARVNVLAHGKELVLPTPRLNKGFVLLDPRRIPVTKRPLAVRPDRCLAYGDRLPYESLSSTLLDVVVAGALAVDLQGNLLGDGEGHLDLQWAALMTLGAVRPFTLVVVLVEEDQIVPSVPCDGTDVGARWIVTPSASLETSRETPGGGRVAWENLSRKQIRRNDALFHLWKERNP